MEVAAAAAAALLLVVVVVVHSVPKKQPLGFLVITTANINRFSKFFHCQIPKKTV